MTKKKETKKELKEVSRKEINGAIIITYEDGSVKIIPAPIVLSAEDEICIEVQEGLQAAVFDGDTIVNLEQGDQMVIRKSSQVTRLVRLKQISFLENLSTMLNLT